MHPDVVKIDHKKAPVIILITGTVLNVFSLLTYNALEKGFIISLVYFLSMCMIGWGFGSLVSITHNDKKYKSWVSYLLVSIYGIWMITASMIFTVVCGK